CDTPIIPKPATVTVYRRADGACIPASELLGYRCSATSVSTLLFGGRGFVGGPHAAPAAPTPTASVVAVGPDATTVATDPADPAAVLMTSAAGVAERWPEVPTWTTPAGTSVRALARPHVFVVGDSVLLGAEGALRAAFADWGIVVDAAVNRATVAGLDVLRTRRAEIQDIAVVGLGYNDGGSPAAWAAQAAGVMDELRDVDLVVWLTLREARDYYVEDNAYLRQTAAAHPNVALADWNAVAPPEGFGRDGLHLNATGAAAMADLVSQTVRALHPTLGRGDQSCRPALDAARGPGG
ncbi:MAG: hypothetical protein ACRD0G_10430, partial [Acidimicrobiales bacterium]